jgi:hypothetical protein
MRIEQTNGVKTASPVHHSFSGRDFQRDGGSQFIAGRDYAMDEIESLLPMVGVGMTRKAMQQVMSGGMIDFAMDSIQQPITSPSISTPIQFLQNWLPGIVRVITAAREIDTILGRSTIGSWEDAEIVQQVVALTGAATPYTDAGNVPLANWNQTFVTRSVVRFELGLRVGNLEEAQAARVRIDSAAEKRLSDAEQLEIQRNAVGFYGYNSGNGRTYGFLNDPNLPAYVNAPNGSWATATFLEIQQDLLTAFQALRTQSQGRIDPMRDATTLTLPTNSVDYLNTTSDFGISVSDWLRGAYPRCRVVSAPQLDEANGSANVFYIHADTVNDSGSDGGATFIQVVPATFQLLGVQKMAKGYEEDYSNATAGVLAKRPYAVVRYSGI